MTDISLKKIREYISCPQLGDDHYGEWGILTLKQRFTIYHLLNQIEDYDKTIKRLMEENDHQKAEIYKLEGSLIEEITRRENAVRAYHEARAEAIKEFAERLKKEVDFVDTTRKLKQTIDNLVKEMVGEPK